MSNFDIYSVTWVILLATVLATLVESFVEYVFGTVFDKVPKLSPWKWLLMYAAMVVGVLLAFYYQLDLIMLVGNVAGADLHTTAVGIILSGLIIGRGANFINDFTSRWFGKQTG